MSSNDRAVRALQWFLSLEQGQQSFLIDNLSEPETHFTPDQLDNLVTIAVWMADVLRQVNTVEAAGLLVIFGMKQVYASKLVDMIISKPALVNLYTKKRNSDTGTIPTTE
jgi:nitrate/nitrite transporter NarK